MVSLSMRRNHADKVCKFFVRAKDQVVQYSPYFKLLLYQGGRYRRWLIAVEHEHRQQLKDFPKRGRQSKGRSGLGI
jgi:hypothetical protein